MSTDDRRARIEFSSSTAEQFIKLYYDRMDMNRHKIGKIYLDNATMSWNGTKVEGVTHIQSFLLDKIPTSEHILHSLDAQPVMDSAVAGQTTVVVQVAGAVRYQSKRGKPFQQNFLLTAQDDKWKVVTDVFRYSENAKT